MGRAIVKQPDGRYAVFSSVVDSFIYLNCTEKELTYLLAEEAAQDSRQNTKAMLDRIKKGLPTGRLGGWEGYLDHIKLIKGPVAVSKLMREMKELDGEVPPSPAKSRRKPYNNTAGYVASRKCKEGGHIVLLDRQNGADWIDADHRWLVVHFPSSLHMAVTSKKQAYDLMKDEADKLQYLAEKQGG